MAILAVCGTGLHTLVCTRVVPDHGRALTIRHVVPRAFCSRPRTTLKSYVNAIIYPNHGELG